MSTGRQFTENVAAGVHVTFDAHRLCHQVKSSAYEKVVIDNAHFGRMLMMDGVVQLSSADGFVYHEMMSHVPLFAHGHAERVLIVGGGDCGLAAEVLKHQSVRELVQVEIDPQVVEIAREYFADINAAVFRDSRFRLIIGDGAEFIDTTDGRFDLILVDSTDPGGASRPLFTREFYRRVRECLRPGGLLIAQLGVPFLQADAFQAGLERLASVFSFVSCYLVPVPCIFGGPLAFGWASSTLSPAGPEVSVLTARQAESRVATRYYTPELHKASFALPAYIGKVVEAATRPHEECARSTQRFSTA